MELNIVVKDVSLGLLKFMGAFFTVVGILVGLPVLLLVCILFPPVGVVVGWFFMLFILDRCL